MKINSIWQGLELIVILAFGTLIIGFTPVSAAAPFCGNGSAPSYGFVDSLQQAHWTIGWENYASEQTVTKVDVILDQLNNDSIAQTMILILPQTQVGNRVNCAVHFLRYMQLGNPTGERKDNGFVFLIVVEPAQIDVHYGVGLGLPALTAANLTNINRATEDAYRPTQNMDQALLTLAQEFDATARSKYTPLVSPVSNPETVNSPQLPSGPLEILATYCLLCLGILFLPFFMWFFIVMNRMGISFGPLGSGSRGMGNPFGGGGRGGGPSMRGGGGSGRSGRGN